jgi:hypothetical protein
MQIATESHAITRDAVRRIEELFASQKYVTSKAFLENYANGALAEGNGGEKTASGGQL